MFKYLVFAVLLAFVAAKADPGVIGTFNSRAALLAPTYSGYSAYSSAPLALNYGLNYGLNSYGYGYAAAPAYSTYSLPLAYRY